MTARSRPRLLLLAVLLLAGACSHRLTLDRHRYDRRIAVDDVSASKIRVLVSHRLRVSYRIPRNGGVFVDTDIHLTGRRQLVHRIVGRRTRGKLVALDERGGRPLLYVSFDDHCSARRCAFGFLASDDGDRFSLVAVPELPPATFSVAARDRGLQRPLLPGFVRHLGELTPVYRAVRPRRGPLTVDLEVVEHVPPRRVRFRIDDGASPERPDAPPRKLTRRGDEE